MRRNQVILILTIVAVLAAVGVAFMFMGDSPAMVNENIPSNSQVNAPVNEPVNEPVVETKKTVKLFYYDPSKDSDETGNVMCTRAGLAPVEREVAADAGPLDVVRLLIAGDLRPEEKAQGITTEYPLPGFKLVSGALADGTLTLTFEDPANKTGGGSCRVGILWIQIEETAKQFPGVREVRFQPEELFQP